MAFAENYFIEDFKARVGLRWKRKTIHFIVNVARVFVLIQRELRLVSEPTQRKAFHRWRASD